MPLNSETQTNQTNSDIKDTVEVEFFTTSNIVS